MVHVRQVDEDKGGSISPQELGSLMETLGLKPNQEELDAMIREIDEDGNGEIEFDEFVQVVPYLWLLGHCLLLITPAPFHLHAAKVCKPPQLNGGNAVFCSGDVSQSSADVHS